MLVIVFYSPFRSTKVIIIRSITLSKRNIMRFFYHIIVFIVFCANFMMYKFYHFIQNLSTFIRVLIYGAFSFISSFIVLIRNLFWMNIFFITRSLFYKSPFIIIGIYCFIGIIICQRMLGISISLILFS